MESGTRRIINNIYTRKFLYLCEVHGIHGQNKEGTNVQFHIRRYEENGITVEEIKRKWKNFRTQYIQELRAMNSSKKSGSGATDIYTPKLWCFEKLDFLRTHSESRKSADNIQEVITEDELNLPSSSGSCTTSKTSSDEPPANKRNKITDAVKDFSNHLESFKNILIQKKSEKICYSLRCPMSHAEADKSEHFILKRHTRAIYGRNIF